ncbi:hypothetical protein Sste5346_009933 [Sporothrix stenoceras]|uniref:Uncharacterized protein n=1 Tax=Sporothrix stenoceras TaxID=5173 RepID=A0ABR3YHS1_9PEZI
MGILAPTGDAEQSQGSQQKQVDHQEQLVPILVYALANIIRDNHDVQVDYDIYTNLLNATGIPKDKIGFGLVTDIDTCGGSGHKTGDGADCWNSGYEFGAPFPNGYDIADVTNPKSISADLPGQIADALLNLHTNSYLGSDFDLVDAVSLPIPMIAQSIESMSVVNQTADKIEEEERKAIILAFLSAIFFFIPVAGEIAGASAKIGTIITILDAIGAASNAALDIYTVVSDPDTRHSPLSVSSLHRWPLLMSPSLLAPPGSNAR